MITIRVAAAEDLPVVWALGYRETGGETRPDWDWTLVYFGKDLA
jgi:hypothetical protein